MATLWQKLCVAEYDQIFELLFGIIDFIWIIIKVFLQFKVKKERKVEAVMKTKKHLSLLKAISLLVIVSIFLEKFNKNSANSSKPPSDDKNRLRGSKAGGLRNPRRTRRANMEEARSKNHPRRHHRRGRVQRPEAARGDHGRIDAQPHPRL